MKKIVFILITFLASIFYSCDNKDNIYITNSWAIKRVNDTVLICIPISHDMQYKPFLLNLNDSINISNNETE